MKVGFYCESPADRAALEVFTQDILGEQLEPINMDLEAHSVPAFFKTLDGVFREVCGANKGGLSNQITRRYCG